MATCSYKRQYWDLEIQQEIEFPCENETELKSGKCIFHDEHYLDDEKNRIKIAEKFQKKIKDYLSTRSDKPFFCIGYHLYDMDIMNKKFSNPVYFEDVIVSGSSKINSTFDNHVSFRKAKFLGEGGVSFSDAKFSGNGYVEFKDSKFTGNGRVEFSRAEFSGSGHVYFDGAEFSGKGEVNFEGTKFLKESDMRIYRFDVSFANAKFLGGDVYFRRAEFSGKGNVYFTSAEFSGKGNVSFSGAKFSGNGYYVSFSGARFLKEGHVDFGGAEFSGKADVDFTECEFNGEGDVDFIECDFKGKGVVNFKDVSFSGKGEVSFARADLLREGDVSFANVNFMKEGCVSFVDAKFSGKGDVKFKDTKFSGRDVDFTKAKFSGKGDVDFTKAKFSGKGDVKFIDTKFSSEDTVYFTCAEFSNEHHVNFEDAKFSNKHHVNFKEAKFSNKGAVDFSHAVFSSEDTVYFTCAEFLNKDTVHFRHTKFFNKGNLYFAEVNFFNGGKVDFYRAKFSNKGYVDFTDAVFFNKDNLDFYRAKFSGDAVFDSVEFKSIVFFRYVKFMSPEDVRFKTEDLSNVSFVNTDITRIFFDENTRFGNLVAKKKKGRFKALFERFKIFNKRRFERFRIFDEIRFERCIDKNESTTNSNLKREELSLGTVLASYRNLRENYEYRLRYEEAGQFFIKEMEMKRKYREELSTSENKYIPKENDCVRRNFSLTGLYYHLSRYGESISRPIILGIIIVGFSTLFWLMQNNPAGEPSISYIANNELDIAKTSADNFINFTQISNNTHTLKAFERSLADFLPLLSMPSDTKVGIIDFIVKIVGGGLTFVLLGVALRRKFERKYTR